MPKTTFVERVLIVMNPEGTLKGAHQESLTRFVEDGEILMERQEGAKSLDAATLASILPDQSALLAELMLLRAEKDALIISVETLTKKVEELEATKEPMEVVPVTEENVV